MEIWIWEQLAKLVNNIFHEIVDILFSAAGDVVQNAPAIRNLYLFAGTGKLRIACNRRNEMPRHINLRNDIDLPLSRIGDNLAHLVLRIVQTAAILGIVARFLMLVIAS